jgi:hypothetical protein
MFREQKNDVDGMMNELTIKMFNEGFAFAVVHRHINQDCVKFHFQCEHY